MQISNKKLKKLKLCDPMICPSLKEVNLLDKLFRDYFLIICNSCQNDSQLQQRFAIIL